MRSESAFFPSEIARVTFDLIFIVIYSYRPANQRVGNFWFEINNLHILIKLFVNLHNRSIKIIKIIKLFRISNTVQNGDRWLLAILYVF